jgi:hypothetical protein
MHRRPDEPKSWPPRPDPEEVASQLRREIERAKARLEEHRAQMQAAGLTGSSDSGGPGRSG